MKNILYTIILSFLFSFSVFGDLQTIMDAAERGDPKAQAELGYMYVMGEGVLQDYEEAVKWFRLAAEQGNARGQLNLGASYAMGQGVLQDYEEAVKWYRLAAEQGNAWAHYNLALAYGEGKGVDYDLVVAYMWFNISTVSGLKADQKISSEQIKQFKDDRDIAANQMTSEQIKEAQKLSRECVKKNYKNCASTGTTPDQNIATQEVASSKTNLTLPPCKGNNWQKYHNCTGTAVDPSGYKYVGEFQKGFPEGQGTLTYPNGDTWVGEMTGGDANGDGTYNYRNGEKYVGEIKRNIGKHGFGIYTFSNGDKYTGEWKNDVQHGQGYWSSPHKPTQQGYYENGQLKQSKQIQNEGIGMRILRAVHAGLKGTAEANAKRAEERRQSRKTCTINTGTALALPNTLYNVQMDCR